MIYIENEFLTKDQCSYLIDFYTEHEIHSFTWGKTQPIKLHDYVSIKPIRSIVLKTLDFVEKIHKEKLLIDNLELVKWPVGAYHNTHLDHKRDIISSIIYLNDNYIGGHTRIRSEVIIPKQGKLLVFYGSNIPHNVSTVEKYARYTLSTWYM